MLAEHMKCAPPLPDSKCRQRVWRQSRPPATRVVSSFRPRGCLGWNSIFEAQTLTYLDFF